jgi:enoyl-CoA hydratase
VKESIYLGRRISAEEAERFGLVNAVVPTGTSVEKALEYAHRLAALPPQALRETKAILNSPLTNRLAADSTAAFAAESRSFDTPEFRANLAAMTGRTK